MKNRERNNVLVYKTKKHNKPGSLKEIGMKLAPVRVFFGWMAFVSIKNCTVISIYRIFIFFLQIAAG